MKIISVIAILFFLSAPLKADSIEEVIPNIEFTQDIVKKYEFIVHYFNGLKVTNTKQDLTQMQKYELARHLLDIHYLCQALYHQGYLVKYNHPVVQLAVHNFPEIKKLKAEGGNIFTSDIGKYFEANPNLWSPSGS